MATESFHKRFVITNQKSINMIMDDLAGPPIKVKVNRRDLREESKRGIERLKQHFSSLKT